MNQSTRLLGCAAAVCILASSAAADPGNGAASDPSRNDATQTWADGQTEPLPPLRQYADQTLREIVHSSIGGDTVRVRISNTFGTAPLAVDAAHVAALSSGSRIVGGSDRVLTFGGQTHVMIAPGAPAVSDPVPLRVLPVSDLAVSIHLPGPTAGETTTFLQPTATTFVAAGNQTAALDLQGATAITEWPFVSGVSVVTDKPSSTVVAITDSATLISQWPAALAARLNKDRVDDLAVVSTAVAGNRLLFNSASPTGPGDPHWGQAVLTRFDRDVLAQAGVRTVIVWIGLNDLDGPGGLFPASEAVTVDDVIAGLKELIGRAHQYGLTILGCTISPDMGNVTLPGFDTPEHNAQREQLNAWIRTSGAFDGVVDADMVLRDPAQPTRLLPAFDSGDHLHPNTTGGEAVANSIDLKLLR